MTDEETAERLRAHFADEQEKLGLSDEQYLAFQNGWLAAFVCKDLLLGADETTHDVRAGSERIMSHVAVSNGYAVQFGPPRQGWRKAHFRLIGKPQLRTTN